MRRGAFALCALVASGAFVPSAEAAGAPAGTPWWPGGVAFPADFRDGWNLRVPLRIANPGPGEYPRGEAVQVHLDLGAELVRVGWPSVGGPGGEAPRSFRADLDSVRLVEYADGWTRVVGPRAVTVHGRWLEPDQESPYQKNSGDAFHESRNPVVTLEWRLVDPLPAQNQILYFVYFEILENSDKPAPLATPEEREFLDGLYGIGAGTAIYGQFTGAPTQVPTLQILGTRDSTSVRVFTYRGGPIAVPDNRPNSGNPAQPLTVGANQVVRYSLGVGATNFRVEATKAVLVYWHPDTWMSGAFVPSLDQGLRGTRFLVPEAADHFVVYAPKDVGSPSTTVTFAGEGKPATTVQADRGTWISFPRENADNPSVPPDPIRRYAITSSQPVLVQYSFSGPGAPFRQAPTPEGSPVGREFQAVTVGRYNLAAWGEPAHVRFFERTSFDERDALSEPVRVGQETPRTASWAFRPAPFEAGVSVPYVVETIRGPPAPEGERGLLQVHVGSGQPADPYGGRGGMEFLAYGPLLVFPYYDQTQVGFRLVGENSEPTEAMLDEGVPFEFPAAPSAPVSVTATKPIAVLPLLTSGVSRFHGAQPAFIVPQVLDAEYRGFLIDAAPRSATDPAFYDVLPGQVLRIPFDVANLGRSPTGGPLPDTVSFSVEANPAGFGGRFNFQHDTMTLQDSTTAANFLEVEMPPDAAPNSVVSLLVRAASHGNPSMESSFTAILLTRTTFGVSLWFGEPTSGSGSKSLLARFQPGQTRDFPFVVRNTGSAPDAYDLALNLLPGGWEATVLGGNQPIPETPQIGPSRQEGFVLRIRAPQVEEVAAVTVSLDAGSRTSEAAADRLLVSARLALEQSLALESAETVRSVRPGSTTGFVVEAVNTGRDAVSVVFALSGTLPSGWQVDFDGPGDPDQGPVALLPGQRLQVLVVLSAPPHAAARQLVSFLVHAGGVGDAANVRDAIALTATAEAVHQLRATAPTTTTGPPGSTLNLTLRVRNEGNSPEAITVVPLSNPGGWIVKAPSAAVLGAGGAERELHVEVTVPEYAMAEDVRLEFGIRGGEGSLERVNTTVVVPPVYDFEWSEASTVRVQRGDSVTLFLRFFNRGNAADTIRLAASAPPGWNATASPASLEVASNSSGIVRLRWDVPATAAPGQATVRLRAAAMADGNAVERAIPVSVEAPRVELEAAFAPTTPMRLGDVVLVTALLRNPGTVPARNVSARLLTDGAIVDDVSFATVGPNQTVATVLRWVVEDLQARMEIEWGVSAAGGAFVRSGSKPIEREAPSPGPDTTRAIPGAGPTVSALGVALACCWLEAQRRKRMT